ncbi:LolA family protein [Sinomonas mesophila]|uniref:LolA family protein n=1 Tax=Sinomonas mesophila TaxID=1531955 RepID=UPI0009873915|nr:hypothetical protein [Sinomonas mesophila]
MRGWRRWIPAAAVPAAIAVGLLAGGASAVVAPPPPATPEQVLALVAGNATRTDARQFSGTLEQRTDLGLPAIPAQTLGPGSGGPATGPEAAVLELLTVPHTARVYADGPEHVRVQVIDQLAERDLVRNGRDVWTYDSKANAVMHAVLPDRTLSHGSPGATAPAAPTASPDDLARRLLAAADPSTEVTLGAPVVVAGRSAYALVLTPRTAGTLVDRVQIAVDAASGMPLAVDVYAKGQAVAAFHAGFTSLSFGAPDPALFTLVPPPGATVTEKQIPADAVPPHAGTSPGDHPTPDVGHAPGWDAIAVIPADRVPPDVLASPLVQQLAVPAARGRLLSSSLVNILLADDGRVLVGAVPASALEAAAAR